MGYIDYLMISQMKELDLFDDIEYKYIKKIIENDDDDIEVEIQDLDCDRVAWCKTRFTFKLNINVSGGCMPLMVDKKFVVEKEYNNSSPYALMMIDLYEEEEEEEEEEVKCMRGCGNYVIKNPFNEDGAGYTCNNCLEKEEEEIERLRCK